MAGASCAPTRVYFGREKQVKKDQNFGLGGRVLIQVDLEGSTLWLASASSRPELVDDRVDLAERINKILRQNRFKLLSWKGDGGVYESPSERGGGLEFAVEAAFAAAKEFSNWRSIKENRASLRLRTTVHFAPDIYVHKNHDYWASDDLNVFIKYEREIGVSGTVAVTDAVYRNLSTSVQARFAASRKRNLGAFPGHVAIKKIHYSPIITEVEANKSNPLGFFEWLRDANLPGVLWSDPLFGETTSFRASIGGACVLFAAPHPDSQLSLDFVSGLNEKSVELNPQENAKWASLQDEVLKRSKLDGKEDGKKVSPFRIVRPLSDIPLADIFYKVETWSRSRSFHQLLEKHQGTLQRLAPQAFEILEEGSGILGIACCHMIVRTVDAVDGVPTVLFCQRQLSGPPDMYLMGRWSLSCEEQMRPSEGVMACVKRGLAEELLGELGATGLTARVLGVVLERSILNLGIIVLVDVPMTFREIVDSWQHSVDKDEHCQLTHFEADRQTYAQLADSDQVPPALRVRLQPSHPDALAATKHWATHPTTLVRLAFCLWAQEMQAIGSKPNAARIP
jgi:hypothetical protein